MSATRDPLVDQALRAVRPADPGPRASDAAAVRVLARLAVRDAGPLPHAPYVPVRRRVGARAVVAAALLVGFALWPLSLDPKSQDVRPHTTPRPGLEARPQDELVVRIDRALSGDALARRALREGGPPARRALLRVADADRQRGPQALSILRSFGAVRSRAEVRVLGRLAARPHLRAEAIRMLAADVGAGGARELGRLLAGSREAEREIVDALVGVARRGRREAAAAALQQGAHMGRVQAAAAALRLGGTRGVESLLDAVPFHLVDHPVLASALASAPRTLRARVEGLAERGHIGALRLGARAHLRGILPVVETRARAADAATARDGVRLLARMIAEPGTSSAVSAALALGRALEGSASAEAHAAVAGFPGDLLVAVAAAARRRQADVDAALLVLAHAGATGQGELAALVRRPALAGRVIAVVGVHGGGEATSFLVAQVERPALRGNALEALGERLRRGDESAGSALLALARERFQRPALRVLARCGEAGVRWLREAQRETGLRRSASAWLNRLGAGPVRGAVRPAAPGFAQAGPRPDAKAY